MGYRLKRIDEFRLLIPCQDDMRVDAMIYADERINLETEAIAQTANGAKIPGVVKALATPDIHVGYGVPIGSVIGLEGRIVPAAVGYDINCGMRLIKTPLDAADVDIVELAESFKRDIPLGEGKSNVSFSGHNLRKILTDGLKGLLDTELPDQRLESTRDRIEEEDDLARCEDEGSLDGEITSVSKKALERGCSQFGTLGGGNHFVELQVVETILNEGVALKFGIRKGQFIIMIHSGSRGFGHQVGSDYMKLAAELNADRSPGRQLSFLETESREGKRYIGAMRAAANFAYANRHIMAQYVRRTIRHFYPGIELPTLYDVPHNMAKPEIHDGQELWVHRKGATRAFPASRMRGTPYADSGQPVLIPGSMGTASYILVGCEESAESLNSVNHGAGRVLSRSAAKGKRKKGGRRDERLGGVSDKDFNDAMRGVHLICASRKDIFEEAPQAYKDIDAVVEIVTGAGLAQAVARLKPLAVLKG